VFARSTLGAPPNHSTGRPIFVHAPRVVKDHRLLSAIVSRETTEAVADAPLPHSTMPNSLLCERGSRSRLPCVEARGFCVPAVSAFKQLRTSDTPNPGPPPLPDRRSVARRLTRLLGAERCTFGRSCRGITLSVRERALAAPAYLHPLASAETQPSLRSESVNRMASIGIPSRSSPLASCPRTVDPAGLLTQSTTRTEV